MMYHQIHHNNHLNVYGSESKFVRVFSIMLGVSFGLLFGVLSDIIGKAYWGKHCDINYVDDDMPPTIRKLNVSDKSRHRYKQTTCMCEENLSCMKRAWEELFNWSYFWIPHNLLHLVSNFQPYLSSGQRRNMLLAFTAEIAIPTCYWCVKSQIRSDCNGNPYVKFSAAHNCCQNKI